ncbi:hypothetical protein K461DRAFT_6083 [Myriangium duriaei CBS 260.36]|uniref:Uncharacterized protein n=1 Tax=Myriangium duriaei CBS 260.36 TaxID=1168546 RepID=A0A9P4ML03_9PEZI|nr:hypothetical protein K461DRAFT_6083 [Myriangium duriaei CBS 260.36]
MVSGVSETLAASAGQEAGNTDLSIESVCTRYSAKRIALRGGRIGTKSLGLDARWKAEQPVGRQVAVISVSWSLELSPASGDRAGIFEGYRHFHGNRALRAAAALKLSSPPPKPAVAHSPPTPLFLPLGQVAVCSIVSIAFGVRIFTALPVHHGMHA